MSFKGPMLCLKLAAELPVSFTKWDLRIMTGYVNKSVAESSSTLWKANSPCSSWSPSGTDPCDTTGTVV